MWTSSIWQKRMRARLILCPSPKFGHICYLIRAKSHGFSVIYTWLKGTSHKVNSQQMQINVDQAQYEKKEKWKGIDFTFLTFPRWPELSTHYLLHSESENTKAILISIHLWTNFIYPTNI